MNTKPTTRDSSSPSDLGIPEWLWGVLVGVGAAVAVQFVFWVVVLQPRLQAAGMVAPTGAAAIDAAERAASGIASPTADLSDLTQRFDRAFSAFEERALARIDAATERAAKERLSDEFLQRLRDQVLDQAAQQSINAPRVAATAPSPAPRQPVVTGIAVPGNAGASDAPPEQSGTESPAALSSAVASGTVRKWLAEALTQASMAKVAIVESYMSNGKMPASNSEAGIDAPASFHGNLVRSLSVGPDGSITVALDPKVGVAGAGYRLVPKADDANGSVQWRCETNVPALVGIAPTCELRRALN